MRKGLIPRRCNLRSASPNVSFAKMVHSKCSPCFCLWVPDGYKQRPMEICLICQAWRAPVIPVSMSAQIHLYILDIAPSTFLLSSFPDHLGRKVHNARPKLEPWITNPEFASPLYNRHLLFSKCGRSASTFSLGRLQCAWQKVHLSMMYCLLLSLARDNHSSKLDVIDCSISNHAFSIHDVDLYLRNLIAMSLSAISVYDWCIC